LKLFKSILKYKGFPVNNAEKELRYLDSLNMKDFKKWGEEKRWEIVKLHYENNPFYRSLFKNKISENWVDLPIIKKSMIQKPLAEMVNPMYEIKNCYIGSTSGSSGTPLFFAKDKFAHAMTWALISKRYNDLGINLNSKQARFYGIPLNSIPYLKERFKDVLMNRYRFTIFDMSDKVLAKFLNKFRHNQFDYIYGYTNSLLLFAKYVISKNIKLKNDICRSLKICIATSEQCTDEDKLLLEKAFGIKVIREYGVSESDFIAISDKNDRWIISDELVYVEIVDENNRPLEDGKVGKIIITSLFNKAMPFIRYEVGDWGSIKRRTDERYSELITLNGRLNDIAYLPSGKIVPGFTLYYVSRQILEESGVLKEYTIKQTSINTFLFEVVTTEPLLERHIELIKNTMYQYLEPGIIVDIKRVDKIERQASGKFKHFHSLVK
jgi:phenylacetate-CoA ligase